jgi:hypothetical protein
LNSANERTRTRASAISALSSNAAGTDMRTDQGLPPLAWFRRHHAARLAPEASSAEPVRIAGIRWGIEEATSVTSLQSGDGGTA